MTIHINVDEVGLEFESAQFYDEDGEEVGDPVTEEFDNEQYTWTGDIPEDAIPGSVIFTADTGRVFEAIIFAAGVDTPSEHHTTATGVALDEDSEPKAGVVCQFRFWSVGDSETEGFSHTTEVWSETSDESGAISVTLWKGAFYLGRREDGPWTKFQASNEDNSSLPEFVGKPSIV